MVSRVLKPYANRADELGRELNIEPEKVRVLFERVSTDMAKSRRQPRIPPPPGGISLREASKKYNLSRSSLSRWVNSGVIPIIRRDANWTYLSESKIAQIAANFNSFDRPERRTLRKVLA